MKKMVVLFHVLSLCFLVLPATAADLNTPYPFGQVPPAAVDGTGNWDYCTLVGGAMPAAKTQELFWAPSAPMASQGYSLYYFTYYYGDGSGDYYQGHVYAPTAFQTSGPTLTVGQKSYYQPQEMGGQRLQGYYAITSIVDGYDSSHDAQEYITSYYDGNTGKTSSTLYSGTGYQTASATLLVSDRRYTAESGYVYDPSVPSSDAYFGNTDVCYDFSTSSSADNNFLVKYNSGLPYWNQPDAYYGCCGQVAGAISLSYWDKSGYTKFITEKWQSNWGVTWPGDTANSPSSYVSFIGSLASYMNYNSGTIVDDIGPGLVSYAQDQGYSTSHYTLYEVLYDRQGNWSVLKTALDAGRPVIVGGGTPSGGGHYEVACGYWNDQQIVANLGWGTSSTNTKIDWNNSGSTSGYTTNYMVDFYLQ